jgi:AcrR family transcriptional regulator
MVDMAERSYYFLRMHKGAETRERIVDRALRLATRDGLDGVTIGALAGELGLSKSGLFAHFGSKEELQLAVLAEASKRFEAVVFRPAVRAARGEARLQRLFENWLQWLSEPGTPGGCVFLAAAVELDDHDGRPRDYLVGLQKQLMEALAKGAQLSIEAGQFRPDLDCTQFAFEFFALLLGCSHWKRLLRDPEAEPRARAAFARLLASARIPS